MYYLIRTVAINKKGEVFMNWNLDKDRPICPQLCEIICVQIASGEVGAGDRLRSVRELAVEAGVNPNTVQKSYEELERMGLIYSARGSGWYVGDDTSVAKKAVEDLVKSKTSRYFSDMHKMGFDEESIKQYVKEWGK